VRAALHGRPTRHQRAWLSTSWAVHVVSPLSPEARATLVEWFARGRPAMVCRDDPGDANGVALSVTLPASRWLATLRFTVGRTAVARRAPPLTLAEAMLSGPPGWLAPLSDLERAAAAVGVPLSVTGALAWQHLTGERYVSPRSPVDLLFQPRTREQLERVLTLLRVREDGEGPPLTGEVFLGWDAAVAWRDLAHGRRRVLVRSAGSETVQDVERLLVGLR
jgi:phosphoribosyl-dephospho-CoA transferase